jgi:hypothetical protein
MRDRRETGRAVVLLPYVAGNSGGASGGLVELGVIGGVVLAAAVKSGLRYGWRPLGSPKGKAPGAHRAAR